MSRALTAAICVALAATPVAAQQQNPFRLLHGSIHSVHVVYDVLRDGEPYPGASVELGARGDAWGMHVAFPMGDGGMRLFYLETGDSIYRWGSGPGEAGLSLRPHLVDAYEALDATERERLVANARLFQAVDADADLDVLTATREGTEMVAGQSCEVWVTEEKSTCILTGTGGVFLRSPLGNLEVVAREVTVNGAVPERLLTLPKGVRWRRGDGVDYGEFALTAWTMANESDPTGVPPATIATEGLRWLASDEAAAMLGGIVGE